MEISYGSGVGIENRFDALFLDESVDPLDAINKTSKSQTKKTKPKKQAKAKDRNSAESKVKSNEQTLIQAPDLPLTNQIKPDKSGNTLVPNKVGTENPISKPITKPSTDKPAIKKDTSIVTDKLPQEVLLRQITLDEYREASSANRRLRNTPKYNLRQPGEGEDLSQWENLVPLEKEKYNDKKVIKEYEYNASEFPQRAGRLKHLPMNLTFGDSIARRGRGRGFATSPVVSPPCPETSRYQRPPLVDNKKEFPYLE